MKPCESYYWLFCFAANDISDKQQKIAKALFKPPTTNNDIAISKIINLLIATLVNSKSYKEFDTKCQQILIKSFIKHIDNNLDEYLWIAVVLFSLFIRINFVGPKLTLTEINEWNKWFKIKLFNNDITSINCHQWLKIDNEDIEFELKYPFLLILSRIIIKKCLFYLNNHRNNCEHISFNWWLIRILRYHQSLLSNRCSSIQNEILKHCEIVNNLFNQSFNQLNQFKKQINNQATITLKDLLKSQFHLEYAYIADNYWKHQIVENQIKLSKESLKNVFNYEMSSKLGKRTKFQIDSKPQLLLMVHSSIYEYFPHFNGNMQFNNELERKQYHLKQTWYLPQNIKLNDETLLDQIKWDTSDTDADNDDNDDDLSDNDGKNDGKKKKNKVVAIGSFQLHYLESCLILFESYRNRSINKVKGISEINELAYLDRLNLNNNISDWCLQFNVLLNRSNVEFTNFNKQIRSVQQHESLTKHLQSIWDECRDFPIKYNQLKTYIKLKTHVNDNDNKSDNNNTTDNIQNDIKSDNNGKNDNYNKAGNDNKADNDNNSDDDNNKNNDNDKNGNDNKSDINQTTVQLKDSFIQQHDSLCLYIGYKRLCGLYGTLLSSRSHILCDLGDLNFSLGFTHAALAIYETLNHSHKIVTCLVNLGRTHDAKQMLLKYLKQIDLLHNNNNNNNVSISHHYTLDKKPYYLCLLGDVTKDNKYYLEAWNISSQSYGRAQRTLAYNYYHSNNYVKCIESCRLALNINQLFPKLWFLLGSAYMKLNEPDYNNVIESFSHVVSIEPTDFEAWNNLGAAHIKLSNFKSALFALQQAGDLRRDNWKIWENILSCSLKLKKLSKSISTLNHLIDIKKNTLSLNPNIIAALTIEFTKKIQKYNLQNNKNDISDPDNGNNNDINKPDKSDDVADIGNKNDINKPGKSDDVDNKSDIVNDDDDNDVVNDDNDNNKSDIINDDNKDVVNDDDAKISKRIMGSLMMQFDKLICKIISRISDNSYLNSISHEHQSPFTRNGLNDPSNLSGINDNIKSKQINYAFNIYEIFAIYFEKCFRIQKSVEIRLKQSRLVRKYFENIYQISNIKQIKEEYFKIIHVLSRLTYCYSLQINIYRNNKNNNVNDVNGLNIKKLQEMLTDIQMVLNRTERLTNKSYINLKESKELTTNLNKLQQLIYKLKNEEKQKTQKSVDQNQTKESIITSAFSDWL